MTGYELRRHLVEHHELDLRGLGYGGLLAIHHDEHHTCQEHDHDDPAET